MNKQPKLDKVNNEILLCKICPINKSGKAVVGEGSPDAAVVFIGEAPGKLEADTGRPFIGRSGKLLRGLIHDIDLKEDDIYITSPVKYLPNGRDGTPGGTPSSQDIAHGRLHLMKQLAIIKPKVVMLLGRVAAEGVLEKKVSVVLEHGKVIDERDGTKYLLTIHPAAALRFPHKFKAAMQEDFRTLKTLV